MSRLRIAERGAEKQTGDARGAVGAMGPNHERLTGLQRAADASGAATRLRLLQRTADLRQLEKGKLVTTNGRKYKKKAKERQESEEVARTLDEQLTAWIDGYGHAEERHVGRTTQDLDGRNIPLATTFETRDDLLRAAKDVITVNEQKINHWYENTDDARLSLWSHRDKDIIVRGRRRQQRPEWHQHAPRMPAHPGYVDVDVDDLAYIVAIFDRDQWSGNPKGLVTCFPSEVQPT